jgi:hypothetical protein
MSKATTVAVGVALLATALPTSPQSTNLGPYRVFNWLEEAGGEFERQGFRPLGPPEGGVLRPHQDASQRLMMRAGHEYQIIGMCDDNCSDLDLSLYSAGGQLLRTDAAPDDLPLLAYAPPTSGYYFVRITMQECSQETCFFGTHVLER